MFSCAYILEQPSYKVTFYVGDILTTLTVLDADVNPVIRYSVIQVGPVAAIFHYIDIHLDM